MPVYVYRAKKGPVETVEGELTAEQPSAALARIEAMGLVPVWVREKAEPGGGARGRREGRVRPRDVNTFTRQLAGLLRSGVPILKSLSTIAEQAERAAFRAVLSDLESMVRDGRMLSDALVKYPELFPPLYVNMVRSGESGGVLDVILLRLADARERDEELAARVQGALAYPALVLGVGLVTVAVMMVFFLPRVLGVLQSTHQVLPLPTRILMGASRFASDYWYWAAALVVLAWAVARRMVSTDRGRLARDRAALRLPVVGRFVRDAAIARFARTLELLVRTDIPIDRALQLSTTTLGNSALRADMEQVRRDTVQMGNPIASGLRRARHVPPFVASMVAVGEESGRLDESLAEVGAFYERELDRGIRLATSLLEPVLILAVGLVVGFIIFAMLLPIFQIGQSVGG